MYNLDHEMFIGLPAGVGNGTKDYSFLRTNGVAEKVYSNKNNAKPYTWMSQTLAIAIDHIAGVPVGGACRQQYIRQGGSFDVPSIILSISIADAASMLVELHRQVWKNLIPRQDTMCKYCGTKMTIDIDLDRISLDAEDIKKVDSNWHNIEIVLPIGWTFKGLQVIGQQQEDLYADYKGTVFNNFSFRTPTLGDAIRNEKHYSDTIPFWRRIAYDCLLDVRAVDASSHSVLAELPRSVLDIVQLKLFDEYLEFSDLDIIRSTLREGPPSLPLHYLEECVNPLCKMETPVTIEANSFFSV